MAGITSIGHIAVRTRDVARSVAFYKAAGLEEVLHLTYQDGSLWLVYMRVSDTQFIEIFPDGDDNPVPAPSATGVNHLCLTVDDLDAFIAALADRGIPLARPRTAGGPDGNRGAWITDPDGNRIELMEMAPGCIQYEAVKRLKAGASDPAVVRSDRMPPAPVAR